MADLFDGIPPEHLFKLGFDLRNAGARRDARQAAFELRDTLGMRPVAEACAEYLKQVGDTPYTEQPLLDPVFCEIANTFSRALSTYPPIQSVGASVTVLITPLSGELAKIERISQSKYRIIINEYFLIVLDAYARFLVFQFRKLCTGKHAQMDLNSDDPVSLHSERMSKIFDINVLMEAHDKTNVFMLLRALSTIYTGFPQKSEEDIESFEEAMAIWSLFLEGIDDFQIPDSEKINAQECFLSAISHVIGHELVHVIERHFDGNVHDVQEAFTKTSIDSPLQFFREMQADADAGRFLNHVFKSIGIARGGPHFLGQLAAFLVPSSLEALSHFLVHGHDSSLRCEVIDSFFLFEASEHRSEVLDGHITPTERRMLAYTFLVGGMDEGQKYPFESELLQLCALVCWSSAVNEDDIIHPERRLTFSSVQHPLILSSTLQARIERLKDYKIPEEIAKAIGENETAIDYFVNRWSVISSRAPKYEGINNIETMAEKMKEFLKDIDGIDRNA